MSMVSNTSDCVDVIGRVWCVCAMCMRIVIREIVSFKNLLNQFWDYFWEFTLLWDLFSLFIICLSNVLGLGSFDKKLFDIILPSWNLMCLVCVCVVWRCASSQISNFISLPEPMLSWSIKFGCSWLPNHSVHWTANQYPFHSIPFQYLFLIDDDYCLPGLTQEPVSKRETENIAVLVFVMEQAKRLEWKKISLKKIGNLIFE